MIATSKLSLPLSIFGLFNLGRSYKAAMAILDAAVGTILTGTKTAFNAPDIANGAQTTTTLTVTGAALGDFVVGVSCSIDLAGLQASGYVSAADTVTILLQNNSGSAINLAAADFKVLVRKA